MKRRGIILISIIAVVAIGVLVTVKVVSKEKNEKDEIEGKNDIYVSEKVTDDCIEEENNIEETNSAEEKISPNSLLILKKYYKECGHTINEYAELPAELVNMNLEQLEKEYPEWEVIGFSNSEVTLYKELEGQCREHFILKNEEGKIVIYRLNESGVEELLKKTDISTEFLTETDLIKIDNGFKVYGQEELNKVLEDFE